MKGPRAAKLKFADLRIYTQAPDKLFKIEDAFNMPVVPQSRSFLSENHSLITPDLGERFR